jgi:hypothetical protein
MSVDNLHNLQKKIQNKVSACFYESLTNCENSSGNPLQEACSGFPKAACDPENCSESLPPMYTVENYPLKEKDNRNRNFMRLSGTIFRNRKFSKKQAET